MTVTANALVSKIKEIYPELGRSGVHLTAELDEEKRSWLVTMRMGDEMLSTWVEADDAEKCIGGVQCVYLGVQIGRFIENYCLGGEACPV